MLTKLFTLGLSLLLPQLLFAEKFALVIGNNEYSYTSKLKNAATDAKDVGQVLSRGGFTTFRAIDSNRNEMASAIDTLSKRAKDSEACLFYFSGHGMEVNGVNYLVPVDGILRNKADLTRRMIPMDYLLDSLKRSEAKRKIVILDCCRNNPFNAQSTGLAALTSSQFPPGTLVVYSGAPGQMVPDGRGRNSPYTEELLRQMTPGRDVLSLFASVAAARYRFQDPWIKFDGSGASFADLRSYDLLSTPSTGQVIDTKKPTAQPKAKARISSYWDHNGSTMGLLTDGNKRVIIYIKVREGLAGLVEPGMVLFDGISKDGQYIGEARRFLKGHPPIAYKVQGPILENGSKVVVSGKAPIRDKNGQIQKVIDDSLEFTYLKLGK